MALYDMVFVIQNDKILWQNVSNIYRILHGKCDLSPCLSPRDWYQPEPRRASADTRPRAETKGWDHIYHVMLFVSYT